MPEDEDISKVLARPDVSGPFPTRPTDQQESLKKTLFITAIIIVCAVILYSIGWYRLPRNRVEMSVGFFIIVFASLLWFIMTWRLRPSTFEQRKDFIDLYAKILGGVTLLVSLYFSWYSLKNTQAVTSANLAIADQTLKNARSNQIAEQYLKNNEKLRDDKLGVRIGAIYALERLASDIALESKEIEKSELDADRKADRVEKFRNDYGRIIQLLTAFVRENASWKDDPNASPQEEPAKDIQAVMNALGKRTLTYMNGEGGKERRLDLHGTDLRGVVLVDNENYEGASFRGANLEKARLRNIRLKDAIFRDAILRNVNFVNADLENVDFADADLEGADFTGAKNLTMAQIQVAENWEKAILPDYLRRENATQQKGLKENRFS